MLFYLLFLLIALLTLQMFFLSTGCPNKHENWVTNSRSSMLRIQIVIPVLKAILLFYEYDNGWKIVWYLSARWTVKTDKFTLFVFCNFLVLLSTPLCSQNMIKQIVNIADENLTDYSFLSRYYFTKSKNILKEFIKIFTQFPCLLEHPV